MASRQGSLKAVIIRCWTGDGRKEEATQGRHPENKPARQAAGGVKICKRKGDWRIYSQ